MCSSYTGHTPGHRTCQHILSLKLTKDFDELWYRVSRLKAVDRISIWFFVGQVIYMKFIGLSCFPMSSRMINRKRACFAIQNEHLFQIFNFYFKYYSTHYIFNDIQSTNYLFPYNELFCSNIFVSAMNTKERELYKFEKDASRNNVYYKQ
jgi:hypothetical protein